jgi:hypothetical protein
LVSERAPRSGMGFICDPDSLAKPRNEVLTSNLAHIEPMWQSGRSDRSGLVTVTSATGYNRVQQGATGCTYTRSRSPNDVRVLSAATGAGVLY